MTFIPNFIQKLPNIQKFPGGQTHLDMVMQQDYITSHKWIKDQNYEYNAPGIKSRVCCLMGYYIHIVKLSIPFSHTGS
jgi:hypothetical protein